ncbi:hypothetical protein DYB30_005500 [Aphanomyces astaci]|uniref:Uncharacterized protein n=1 Tax=Aphanomyces astaci TaxID=112090 RepID=A0A397C5N9_APHAT|nr:hypothetical protein DYB30_005500 [Aphanomyces astaci]
MHPKFVNLYHIDNITYHCSKVVAFCDVNEKKIGTKHHDQVTRINIPIIHFRDAVPPIVCCVSMGRTDGELEANVRSLNLVHGVNFWHFI